MRIISVTGTASDAGKTTVASFILRNLPEQTYSFIGKRLQTANERAGSLIKHEGGASPYHDNAENEYELLNHRSGWGALKITVRHEGPCPRHRHRQTECDTCDSVNEPYKISTSDDVIKEKGKDTGQLSRAGASKVVWLQTDSQAEKVGLKAALSCFGKEHTIIVEGNSFLRVRDANVAIMVASPSVKKIKRSAAFLLKKNKIDFVAINVASNHTPEQIEECRERLRDISHNVPDFVINPFMEDGFSNQAFIDKIQELLRIPIIGT